MARPPNRDNTSDASRFEGSGTCERTSELADGLTHCSAESLPKGNGTTIGLSNSPANRLSDNLPNGSPKGHENGIADHLESHLDSSILMKDMLEPVAVIGMALKFPLDATSPATFWEMLMDGRSAMTDVPKERFNIDAFYHSKTNKTGVLNVRGGHFIKDNLAGFDAPFFSMNPTEAACMDPQQRWLLEIAYEALENAGIPMEQARGSKTSVHIGSFLREYELLLSRDPQMEANYKATGTALAMVANRLSWYYDFTGPSIALDTACSSSLNALHLACQSLRCGESTMGLVGGCNLFYNPDSMIELANLNCLSPDSICYSFDHRANGYSRGEGLGIVIIKLLSKALQDGDTIRAVVRATGANQDGRTAGITQPSGTAQEAMIRETYAAGGLEMAMTRYFEAHGTGTAVGDPIEASAINSAFRDKRPQGEAIYIGAVKSNIGHLEGASGIAGLIKAILVLEKGVIPPNIWFERPNPKIEVDKWNIKFPCEPTCWPTNGLRRASVSSFGFGGSNAHAVLDDAYHYLKLRNLHGRHSTRREPPESHSLAAIPSHDPTKLDGAEQSFPEKHDHEQLPKLFVWSASEESGLKRLATTYHEHLRSLVSRKDESSYLADLAYTLSEKRSRLPWKSFAIARSIDTLQGSLDYSLRQPFRSVRSPKLGFIFTGQGAQWYAMGRELLQYSPFRRSLEEAEAFLRDLGCTWLLIEELLKDKETSDLADPAYSQPVCTALQIALVDLLFNWGITPAVVIGHSSGEIAAAYCAGGLSRPSAWKVAYFRGMVVTSLKNSHRELGTMMSVGASEADIQTYLCRTESDDGYISVGCVNSPRNITVSGSNGRIAALEKVLQQDDVFTRRLKVDVAYHSRYMDDVASVYGTLIQDIDIGTLSTEQPTMFSSVTGRRISSDELSESGYWVKNMVSPVKFLQALTNISSPGPKKLASASKYGKGGIQVNHVLEIGPHATLQGPIRDTLSMGAKDKDISYSSVLVRCESAVDTALKAAGGLYCMGYPVDLKKVNNPKGESSGHSTLVNLPAYPFNHSKQYWLESRLSKNFRFRKFPHHELLGTPVSDWNPLEARWRHIITLPENPWLRDHKVHGSEVYPATGMLVMAVEAARQLADPTKKATGYHFRDVAFHKALLVPLTSGVEAQFHLRPSRETTGQFLTWSEFRLCAYDNGEWAEICRGSIAVAYDKEQVDLDGDGEAKKELHRYNKDYSTAAKTCNVPLGTKQVYNQFEDVGLTYGPTFQSLKDVHVNREGEAIARVNLREWISKAPDDSIQPHIIHPAALDAIFQLTFPALTNGGEKSFPTMVPSKISNMWISHNEGNAVSIGSESNQPEDAVVNVHAKTKTLGFRSAEFSVLALYAEDGRPCVIAEAQVVAVASLETPLSSGSGWRRICYNLEWKPDLDLLENEEISSYCSRVVSSTHPNPEAMKEEKRLACYLAILKTNEELLQEYLPRDKLHLRRYFEWMKHQVSIHTTNYPTSLMNGQTELRDLAHDNGYLEQLHDRLEKGDAEGKLVVRVARNLVGILRGEVDVLDLLFNDSLMQEYYQYIHHSTSLFRQLSLFIDSFAHKNPGTKVLEIGAGTGGATEAILRTLMPCEAEQAAAPRFAEYVFTDISPSFLETAREKFQTCGDRMAFATLDIEQDPLQQGFEAGKYDLLIASQVLHATASLHATLRCARKLLKPGGRLILYESITPESLMPGFMFGLLSGWWLGTEENRRWGPMVTEKDWHVYLTECGFSGVDIALRDYEEEQHHESSVLVSTALQAIQSPSILPKPIIVPTEDSPLQYAIAGQLKARLEMMGCPACEIVSLPGIGFTNLDQTTCIFLPELEQPFLYEITAENYTTLQKIISSVEGLLWTSVSNSESARNPTTGMITGFSRCIRGEDNRLKFATLGLQDVQDVSSVVHNIAKVFQKTFITTSVDCEPEFAELNGMLCVSRVVEANYLNRHILLRTRMQVPELRAFRQRPLRRLKLSIGSPGLLDSLQFVDDAEAFLPIALDEIEVEVKASGVNFRDVLIALGQNEADFLGIECAGVVTQVGERSDFQIGDRVCCMVEGSLRTYVHCKAITACRIPDEMTFQSAAAIPVLYPTALYALNYSARMKDGESVLIHSGAGGLGQASIQLAKLLNADIFVTVGTEDKKKFLMNTYDIPEDHIFSSRTPSFAQGIKRMTNGRGVDVIINSLAGEALRTTWECIAPCGRFIETGKKDICSFGNLPMSPFSKNVTFAAVDLAYLYHNANHVIRDLMQAVMTLMKEKKITLPKPLEVYSGSQIEDAFRFMQSGKSKGKMVIEFHDDDMVPTVPSMLPKYSFDSDATYLIAGGLGGLGRSIARWLVSRNARNLILLSRSRAHGDAAQALLNELEAKGVNVATPPCDVSNKKALASVLAECCKTMPPVKGCIQGSMVLKDALFENMSRADFEAAVQPKVQGSWNLHSLLPKGMDFFVLLSSLSGVVGVYGQANYASGNTYQDALARYRIAHGERAVSLDLGSFQSIGYVAEREGLADTLKSEVYLSISEGEFHAMLDYYCDPALSIPSPLHSQVVTGLDVPADFRAKHVEEPFWMSKPIFRQLYQVNSQHASSAQDSEGPVNYETLFRGVESLAEAGHLIVDGLRTKLSKTLAIEKEAIDASRPMHTYGVDSLAAVEVRTWFRRVIGADVAVFEMLGNGSITSLGLAVAAKSPYIQAALKKNVDEGATML